MKNNEVPSNQTDVVTERRAILTKLETAINTLETDLTDRTPRSPEEQRLQLRAFHELGYLANQYRKLKRDTDIDTLAHELEVLKSDTPPGQEKQNR